MKKLISVVLTMGFLIAAFPAQSPAAKGGCGPFFASCCLGPRIGLEMNEGKEIKVIEWLRLIIPSPILAIFQGAENGVGGYFASCCLGPRVGEQLNKRKIRTLEWLRLVPVVSIVAAVIVAAEAGQGKTMIEIEAKEGLKK
ncbi:MAG TPA: hypothetical protein PK876_04305 [Elusimicrobiota bacterium]|nr:hypothetical protein [Elusimicrobiota bacterium]